MIVINIYICISCPNSRTLARRKVNSAAAQLSAFKPLIQVINFSNGFSDKPGRLSTVEQQHWQHTRIEVNAYDHVFWDYKKMVIVISLLGMMMAVISTLKIVKVLVIRQIEIFVVRMMFAVSVICMILCTF